MLTFSIKAGAQSSMMTAGYEGSDKKSTMCPHISSTESF
ncbi:predicted protein [Botrytis cinerea T4]|uniref:Uncharacterized protein n=1 Tax=Botryotinia fuckeliana (strain T4) TaxID=999810 RepID=G2XTZ5_BOTF4|nr:predicted protein [Botrytis cinerea T4]